MKKNIITLIAGLLLGIILSLCVFKIASLKTAKSYDKQLLEKLKDANITVLKNDYKDPHFLFVSQMLFFDHQV